MMDNFVTPASLLEILFVAANAKTPEEQARVAWRASDHMWRGLGNTVGLPYARAFNNLLQEKEWPWVQDLWSKDEVRDYYKSRGMSEAEIAAMFPALNPA
jgi:hypothetical protein